MKLEFKHYLVGRTLAGKNVFSACDSSDVLALAGVLRRTYSSEDVFDAFAIFEYLAYRARKRQESDRVYRRHSNAFHRHMSPAGMQGFKERRKLSTSIDICQFGRSLVAIEFQEL